MSSKTKIRFVADRVVKDHNGRIIDRFKQGQVVELSDASARHWLNRQIAVLVPPKGAAAADEPPAAERPEGDDLISDIASKIDALDPNEDFTNGGVPNVAALEKACGYNITAQERDAAWLAYEAMTKPTPPAKPDRGAAAAGKSGSLV